MFKKCFISLMLVIYASMGHATQSEDFLFKISEKVIDLINQSKEVPGLKTEELIALKAELANTWNTLIRNGVLEVNGADKEVRPYFVALQGIVEQVLANELQDKVTSLRGFIHTPMPATPLCTKGEISKELVDRTIEKDPARLYTVKARATIVRDYLYKGGLLYICYPKEGFSKRSTEQQKIYQQELLNYPSRLFDMPLLCDSIPTDLIGATYLFQQKQADVSSHCDEIPADLIGTTYLLQDQGGTTYVFAIKMTQAKDPQEHGSFALWFGPKDHPAIQERLRTVSTFLETHGAKKPLF